tara:strand:+ start:161 stop:508 length:348 start_codon:yes stop_codon:yes gene_type:complete
MFEQEQREALRLLKGIEEGGISTSDCYEIFQSSEPALVYLIFTWIRTNYPSSHKDAQGVLGRMLELTQNYDDVLPKVKKGEADVIVQWFEDTYSYSETNTSPDEFIRIIIEKLEG